MLALNLALSGNPDRTWVLNCDDLHLPEFRPFGPRRPPHQTTSGLQCFSPCDILHLLGGISGARVVDLVYRIRSFRAGSFRHSFVFALLSEQTAKLVYWCDALDGGSVSGYFPVAKHQARTEGLAHNGAGFVPVLRFVNSSPNINRIHRLRSCRMLCHMMSQSIMRSSPVHPQSCLSQRSRVAQFHQGVQPLPWPWVTGARLSLIKSGC